MDHKEGTIQRCCEAGATGRGIAGRSDLSPIWGNSDHWNDMRQPRAESSDEESATEEDVAVGATGAGARGRYDSAVA